MVRAFLIFGFSLAAAFVATYAIFMIVWMHAPKLDVALSTAVVLALLAGLVVASCPAKRSSLVE